MNKLINVFLEPRETFTSLQEQNNWKNAFLPIVITAVVGFASMVVLGELLTEVQIEQTETFIMESSQIPDDQKEEILAESLEKFTNPTRGMVVIGYISSTLSTPVRILIMSLIIMLIGNFFFGRKINYLVIFLL